MIQTLAGGPIPVHSAGVYTATTGPRLETPAEIRKYKILGGDLVGMTLVPEVFLARELELCYAAVCYVVNYAEGVQGPPLSAGSFVRRSGHTPGNPAGQSRGGCLCEIVLKLLPELVKTARECPCPWLMERYRQRGDIGEDWRDWFK